MTATAVGDIEAILEGLEGFLAAEVDTLHAEHPWLDDPRAISDERGWYRPEVRALIGQVRQRSAAAGYYTMVLPAGSDTIGSASDSIGFEGMFSAWELVFRRCGTRRWLGHHSLAHWTKGPSPLLRHAVPAVREAYLPDLVAGRTSMCFALSEPDAGSDTWMLRTRARRVDDGWSLSGAKQWISNGGAADLAVVFAVTDADTFGARKGGVGAFLVRADSDGFGASGNTPMFGHPTSNEAILHLDDVFVPDDHVLGDPLQGFPMAMEGVSLGRMYNCAKAVGLARFAFDAALAYSQERQAFGGPIAKQQAISFGLADSAIGIHAARLVSLDCARLLDSGAPGRKELAMAKVLATETALAVIDRAMQVHGAMGFTNELGLAEAWQMIRVICVADGTSEILRRQVAAQLLKGDVAL